MKLMLYTRFNLSEKIDKLILHWISPSIILSYHQTSNQASLEEILIKELTSAIKRYYERVKQIKKKHTHNLDGTEKSLHVQDIVIGSVHLFGGDSNRFWDTVKRVLQGGGLHIVAFASYRYWGAYSGPD